METWYKVTLSQEDVLAFKNQLLQNEFADLWDAKRVPKDAAMFDNNEGAEHHFYFSPGAVRIAKNLIERYAGMECAAPSRSEVGLLVGSQEVDEIPFSRSL